MASSLDLSACCWDHNDVPLTAQNWATASSFCSSSSLPSSPLGEQNCIILARETPNPMGLGGSLCFKNSVPACIPVWWGSPSLVGRVGENSVIGWWSSYFLLLHVHPHLFEISLPTPAWLAGMSLRSFRPKWKERTDWLPTARKRGQHLGIYQKTRMCLFICLFILHLKSGYCSNWIRGKDLSPKEPWPRSPIQQGWKSQDNEWSLMPSHEEALSTADISLLPCLSSRAPHSGKAEWWLTQPWELL